MQFESMYQEIILDHYRNPHHRGLREPYDAEVHHVNPLCGDEVTLRVSLKAQAPDKVPLAALRAGGSIAANGSERGAQLCSFRRAPGEIAGGDPVVADVSYDSLGCSISQASASVLADLLIGKSIPEAMQVHRKFLELMQSKGQGEPDEDVLEDAVAFAGVSKYPARIKCALLAWMAWKDATARALDGTATA
jgi:nitrogen fixation protein NifU and related proteins